MIQSSYRDVGDLPDDSWDGWQWPRPLNESIEGRFVRCFLGENEMGAGESFIISVFGAKLWVNCHNLFHLFCLCFHCSCFPMIASRCVKETV